MRIISQSHMGWFGVSSLWYIYMYYVQRSKYNPTYIGCVGSLNQFFSVYHTGTTAESQKGVDVNKNCCLYPYWPTCLPRIERCGEIVHGWGESCNRGRKEGMTARPTGGFKGCEKSVLIPTVLVVLLLSLYDSLFLLPLLPITVRERDGERESQRIDRGVGSRDSLAICAANHGLGL